jgi:hypothetical protein
MRLSFFVCDGSRREDVYLDYILHFRGFGSTGMVKNYTTHAVEW